MSKEIWLNPVLGNSRERLVSRSAEMIADGEASRLVYITASHPLLELVTKWLLDFDTIRGVWGTLPVFLFRGFVRQILTTARAVESDKALVRRTPIDTEDSQLKRSVLSQIMRSLVATGDLVALAPLAHRDGTVNTVATLIGEIQRAGKTPEDFQAIIESRAADFMTVHKETDAEHTADDHIGPRRQIDFDREIGRIYQAYARALDDFLLSDEDADQLRALQVLQGEVCSTPVAVPWIANVQLLVLDGFFDFTPVQGEMLRQLIPRVSNVIVNLYGDEQNPEVFRPFADTIEQLRSISEEFKIVQNNNSQIVEGVSAALRARLFNPEVAAADVNRNPPETESPGTAPPAPIQAESDNPKVANNASGNEGGQRVGVPRLFRCRDREAEIRAIAKEIKRLVLVEGFSIRDIALVVRQRTSYAETIARIFRDEAIPCTVENVVGLSEVPAVRALLKLFQLLDDDRHAANPRVTDLADVIKSGYFRLSMDTIRALRDQLPPRRDQSRESEPESNPVDIERAASTVSYVAEPGIGEWNPDALENVFAYVGSDLPLDKWIERARRLASNDATATNVRAEIFATEFDEEEEESGQADGDQGEEQRPERKTAPSREIQPALLEWTALVLLEFAAVLNRVPREAGLADLRTGFLKLLEKLQFADSIRESITQLPLESALPYAALDLRALEGIRLATAAALESIEIASKVAADGDAPSVATLSTFISEVQRCISAQSLRIASADQDGLQVLEATDVRGLRFRAVFVAGLIEGGFPLRKARDWIYPHEERDRLKEYGLTLEDTSPATLLKEEHYFYQATCRATEALYLTWPMVEGGGETVVSYYIDEVRHALAPLELRSEDVGRDYEGDRLLDSSSPTELAACLIRLSERHNHHGRRSLSVSADGVAELLVWAEQRGIVTSSALKRIAITRERASDHFGPYDGLITSDNLKSLLSERYGSSYVWSASALSLYGKSPFKFFVERVLKLEPPIEAALDLAVLDAGGLLHEALRKFFVRHRGQRLERSERATLRSEMRAIAAQVFDEHERAVPPLNIHVWEIDREIYQLQLAQVVDYEIDLQSRSGADGVLPTYFELGFGMARGIRDQKSTSEFLVLERDDGSRAANESIRLRGQIDRLDLAADGTVIAYDYKLSRGAAHADMIEGRDLQIAIYLDAVEKLFRPEQQIAGGGYYILRRCDRNRGLYRKAFDKYTHLGTSVKSRVEEHEWLRDRATMRRRIWQFVDAVRAGRFIVNPTAPEQTCDICEFSPVCRYEKYRILRKRVSGHSH